MQRSTMSALTALIVFSAAIQVFRLSVNLEITSFTSRIDESKSESYVANDVLEAVLTDEPFQDAAALLRNRFRMLYRPDENLDVLDKGYYYPSGVDPSAATEEIARRFALSVAQERPFKISFGGYSVTAGRGNYFREAYPQVFSELFAGVAKEAGVELLFSNAAIGGVPSFPYGWCMENYYGRESDVISWEFTLNEGRQNDLFEAFLRYSTSLPRRPLVIISDGRYDVRGVQNRRKVLDHYSSIHADSFFIDARGAYMRFAGGTKEEYDEKDKKGWPEGFLNFHEFTTPPAAPGKAPHHPGFQHHKLAAFLIAIRLLDGLQFFVENRDRLMNDINKKREVKKKEDGIKLPDATACSNLPIYYGCGDQNEVPTHKCWTSYKPSLAEISLKQIVSEESLDPVSFDKTDLDDTYAAFLAASSNRFAAGWISTLMPKEMNAKRQVEIYQLGYIDGKELFLGSSSSGELKISVPVGDETNFIVVCEGSDGDVAINGDEYCNLEKHADFWLNDNKLKTEQISVGGNVDGIDPCIALDVGDISDLDEENDSQLRILVVNENTICGIAQIITFG